MKKNYLITSVQSCASPHSTLLEGFDFYAEDNNSEIIVLPLIGQDAKQDFDRIHSVFKDYYDIEEGNRKLNNNIQIEQFNLRPQQIDPATGLSRFAQRETTLVFGSPKQRLKPIPHSNKKYPKFLVTTGACTRPNYATGQDVSAERRRLGGIARRDHTYGGLIVEIENNEIFHMRHIRADQRGSFVDLGVRYDGNYRSDSVLEALVLGDYHMDWTLPEVRKTTFDMIKKYKPKRLVLHDFFDGHSVSHWVDKRFIEYKIIQQTNRDHHILEKELKDGYDELCKLSELMEGEKIYFVGSNHHEF
ncbi:hypothetical protein LCGC14_2751380, partial [marine sediment metagenome]